MIQPFPCEILSWEDMYEYSRVLAGKLREDKFRPDAVVAIARGGYVPARNLCDFLMVTQLYSFKVDHWGITAQKDQKARVSQELNADLKGKNVLLVDDLADTGQSLTLGKEHVLSLKPKKLKTAALFMLEKSGFHPDYYAARKPWRWFVFPWNFTEDMCHLVSGLFDAKSTDKKSLDMVKEELHSKHKIRIDGPKLRQILDELVHRRILTPYWVSGKLVRWMSFQKPIAGGRIRRR